MTFSTLKSESALFYRKKDVTSFFSHTVSTASQKKLLLLGNFNAVEQKQLMDCGYNNCQLFFNKKKTLNTKLKGIALKEICAIIIKNDHSNAFLQTLEVIKKQELNLIFPILLYSEPATDLHQIQKLKLIDEVIYNIDNKNLLDFKIEFLSKFKKLSSVQITFPDTIKSITNQFNLFIRRIFDIVVSGTLLIILLPVLILIALILKIESKGPIFYISKRAGKYYKVFSCIKFRTMVVGADKKLKDLKHLNQYDSNLKNIHFVKIKNDPRITRFGMFLRNTSLDELPQLFNVLKGDMSLVGNRPLPLYEASTLTVDSYANRFNAPAGITGLWQVLKRGESEMSTEERIELDIKYAKNNSLLVDIWIIIKTPFAMFQKTNV